MSASSIPAAAQSESGIALPANRKPVYGWVVLLLIGIGAARIVFTYPVFTQTADEPSQVANGMQLMQQRVYFMDVKHPPLARMAVALGPYLAGLRLSGPGRGIGTELGNEVFNSNHEYGRNLTLARIGVLPFFILACIVVWLWSAHLFGRAGALLSLGIFSFMPAVLAHSSQATNDLAGAATLCLALYWFTRWLENPSWGPAARLGLGGGLAAATKFSAFLFFPCCAIAITLVWVARERRVPPGGRTLIIALLIAWLVLWGGYLFTLVPIESTRPHTAVDRYFGGYPFLHNTLCRILETPIPAGKVVGGLAALSGHDRAGQVSFFLGEWRRKGWWYFFPIIFLLKTPLPFLLLSGIGAVFLVARFSRPPDWRMLAPLLPAVVILSLSMLSHINVGSRHILALYPLLSIVSGYAVIELWRRQTAARLLVAGCVLWLFTTSVLAHPNYLTYFNVLAGSHPERIEVDSDLDWGQDLGRLSRWLRAHGVTQIAISYFGTTDLRQADLPNYRELEPYRKIHGWVAISARNLQIPNRYFVQTRPEGESSYYSIPGDFAGIKPGDGPFAWLTSYKPVAKIGSSIFVYNIAEGER